MVDLRECRQRDRVDPCTIVATAEPVHVVGHGQVDHGLSVRGPCVHALHDGIGLRITRDVAVDLDLERDRTRLQFPQQVISEAAAHHLNRVRDLGKALLQRVKCTIPVTGHVLNHVAVHVGCLVQLPQQRAVVLTHQRGP